MIQDSNKLMSLQKELEMMNSDRKKRLEDKDRDIQKLKADVSDRNHEI
jgi:hypothetical protein